MHLLMSGPLRVIERVGNHPDHQAVAVFRARVTRRIDLRQVRAVGQLLERLQDQVFLHADEEFLAASVECFPVVVAEKAAVLQEQRIGRQAVPQFAGQGLFAVLPAADLQGQFHMGAQLDQARLADLRERPVAARPRGPRERRRVGRTVRRVIHRTIDANPTQAAPKSARRLRRCQRPDDVLMQILDRRHTQALSRFAQARTRRRVFFLPHAPGVLEHLTNRQGCEQTHCQHHPEHDLVVQLAAMRIDFFGRHESLRQKVGSDNLLQSRQSIQNSIRLIGRKRRASWLSHCHSLPGSLVLSKHKVPDGCGLREDERYCA